MLGAWMISSVFKILGKMQNLWIFVKGVGKIFIDCIRCVRKCEAWVQMGSFLPKRKIRGLSTNEFMLFEITLH